MYKNTDKINKFLNNKEKQKNKKNNIKFNQKLKNYNQDTDNELIQPTEGDFNNILKKEIITENKILEINTNNDTVINNDNSNIIHNTSILNNDKIEEDEEETFNDSYFEPVVYK